MAYDVVIEKTRRRRDCGGGGRNLNDLPYFAMVMPGDGITIWSYAPEQKARRRSRCVRKIDLRESARDRHKRVAAGDNVTFDMTKSRDPFRFLLIAVSRRMNQQHRELID